MGRLQRIQWKYRWLSRSLAVLVLLAAAAAGGYVLHVRVLRGNLHTVVDSQVYRSAQPSAWRLREWVHTYGLRSILNLRGTNPHIEDYRAERRLAEQYGMEMVDIGLGSKRLPNGLELRRLVTSLETLPRPILIHCNGGSDRSGLASTLAAMAVGGEDFFAAREQFGAEYFHFAVGGTRIQDLLKRYEAYCRREGLDPQAWMTFRTWAMEVYTYRYFHLAVDAPRSVEAAPGARVPIEVTITNLSDQAIPAGGDKVFFLGAFAGGLGIREEHREFAERVALPRKTIAPGESATVTLTLLAPQTPGETLVCIDAVRGETYWFTSQGSRPHYCLLRVREGLDGPSVAQTPPSAQQAAGR